MSAYQPSFDEEEIEDELNSDPDRCVCERCGGCGKVVTEDYESYLGADYKPCPMCEGDPCEGERPVS